MRRIAAIILLAFLAAACQPAEPEIPTLMVLPTETTAPTLTNTPTSIPTDEPSETPRPTETSTETEIPTATHTPSNTPIPSETPTPTETPDATGEAVGTSTAAVIEAPIFSTFTPLPPGIVIAARPTSTGTPQVVADVVITQSQYREEVNRILAGNLNVTNLELDIAEAGVFVNLTASGGDAFTTGRFLITFDLSVGGSGFNNLVIIQASPPNEFVMSDGGEPSEEFLAVAYGDVTEAVFEAFDDMLNQRLGQGQHDLEFIILEDGRMNISLLVPER